MYRRDKGYVWSGTKLDSRCHSLSHPFRLGATTGLCTKWQELPVKWGGPLLAAPWRTFQNSWQNLFFAQEEEEDNVEAKKK